MKQKHVAGLLALFLGIWGTHRFYLNQRAIGVLYIFLFFIGMGLTFEADGAPIFAIPAVIGLVDAVLFFAMPKEEFDERYNGDRLVRRSFMPSRPDRANMQRKRPSHKERLMQYKRSGIEKFRAYEYEEAIRDFSMALKYKYDDRATHFNMACCFSILEDAPSAYEHLEKAVQFGFRDLRKIHEHDALSFLRGQPDFEDFVFNEYRRIQALPSPTKKAVEEVLGSQPEATDDLLDQIIKLGELKEKGILTQEEFVKEKKKLLK